MKKITTAMIFWILVIGFLLGWAFNANSQTVEVTAQVKYNACNIHTSYIPAPTELKMYDWGFTAMIGDSFFYAIRSENRMTFYLDSASWYYDGVDVVFDECEM